MTLSQAHTDGCAMVRPLWLSLLFVSHPVQLLGVELPTWRLLVPFSLVPRAVVGSPFPGGPAHHVLWSPSSHSSGARDVVAPL
eukprot:9020641-Pyramimonas_sp.AAC.1